MTRLVSVNVGGLWQTNVNLEEGATWLDLKKHIKHATGINTFYQQLTPNGNHNERCELTDNNVLCEWRSHNGKHPMHYAAENNNVEAMRSWMTCCADINVTSDDGDTPLMRALFYLNEECVAELLKLGANVSVTNKNGRTALHMLVCGMSMNGRDVDTSHLTPKFENMTRMLATAGCDPSTQDRSGETAANKLRKMMNDRMASQFEEWLRA